MNQFGAPLAVSLLCDINTGKNQSDCTNCLKCLRMKVTIHSNITTPVKMFFHFFRKCSVMNCGKYLLIVINVTAA